MNDRRTMLLTAGLAGLAAGVAAIATDTAWLGLVAGIIAVVTSLGSVIILGAPRPDASPAASIAAVGFGLGVAPATPTGQVGEPRTSLGGIASGAGGDRGLVDLATGLFSEEFFKVAVETRVLAARRHLRPVAVVLFEVIDGAGPGVAVQSDPTPVSAAIKQTLREADTACRLDDGRYGFVLEDTPEDGAIWTVERLRRKLSETMPEQTRWAGIACYPAHAFSADEVLSKAEHAFASAREWAQDRIEVAAAE